VDAAKVIGMADPFTPDAFYTSAQDFALRALDAHHTGDHRCVPLFAGTAIEHLAKACLARRSPALLVDLAKGSSFDWLVALLRIEGAGGRPVGIRTISLTEALNRMNRFITSKADQTDLQTLVAMRNGVIHAAEGTEVEERILTAFVQQAEALLADFGRERGDFWKGQLSVVNALLTGATDKVRLRVEMKLAAAEANLDRLYQAQGEAVLRALRTISKATSLEDDQTFRDCPVCGSGGIATGEYNIWGGGGGPGRAFVPVPDMTDEVWFDAQTFSCPVCNLRLDSVAEIDAAGLDTSWQVEGVNWGDRGSPFVDEDAAYEHYREERGGL
jgi:hypothetical protein